MAAGLTLNLKSLALSPAARARSHSRGSATTLLLPLEGRNAQEMRWKSEIAPWKNALVKQYLTFYFELSNLISFQTSSFPCAAPSWRSASTFQSFPRTARQSRGFTSTRSGWRTSRTKAAFNAILIIICFKQIIFFFPQKESTRSTGRKMTTTPTSLTLTALQSKIFFFYKIAFSSNWFFPDSWPPGRSAALTRLPGAPRPAFMSASATSCARGPRWTRRRSDGNIL